MAEKNKWNIYQKKLTSWNNASEQRNETVGFDIQAKKNACVRKIFYCGQNQQKWIYFWSCGSYGSFKYFLSFVQVFAKWDAFQYVSCNVDKNQVKWINKSYFNSGRWLLNIHHVNVSNPTFVHSRMFPMVLHYILKGICTFSIHLHWVTYAYTRTLLVLDGH